MITYQIPDVKTGKITTFQFDFVWQTEPFKTVIAISKVDGFEEERLPQFIVPKNDEQSFIGWTSPRLYKHYQKKYKLDIRTCKFLRQDLLLFYRKQKMSEQEYKLERCRLFVFFTHYLAHLTNRTYTVKSDGSILLKKEN